LGVSLGLVTFLLKFIHRYGGGRLHSVKPFDLPLVSLLNNFKTLEPVKAPRHLFAIGLFAENNSQRTRIRIDQ